MSEYKGGYHIESLKANNWMPWKRRILAVLRDLDLERYIDEKSTPPRPVKPTEPTSEETKAIEDWKTGDAKTRTRIELSLGDSEMIHISGAETASQMWKQLKQVKESKGKLGILATRRSLYRAMAEEGFDMIEHISQLRKLQEELHAMGHKVEDEDFIMILITSLPESWDSFTSAYLGARSGNTTIASFELAAILIDEDRRRKERGDSVGTTLQTRNRKGGKKDNGKECSNCRKKGHSKEDCWNKGGGKEGQGPKGLRKGPNRANQVAKEDPSLNQVAYMARKSFTSQYDWYLDSGTTSHICPIKDAFTNYTTTPGAEVAGIGPTPAKVAGRGTIILNCDVDGKLIRHQLHNVLHIPDAKNSLISTPRLDAAGLWSVQGDGKCWIRRKGMDGVDLAIGDLMENPRLYKIRGRAELPGANKANLAKTQKLTWDQWHARFGHLSISALDRLKREGLVDGLEIDESSIPSRSCDSCIQAKQAHKPFPKEAENRSSTPGERFMGDVWGPTKRSVGRFHYFITFTDDASHFITVLFLQDKAEAFDPIKGHVAMLRKQNRAPKYMRFDNGKELINQKLEELARHEGITIEPTAPYSPSQNGVAERFNRTLLELARAMLFAKDLPKFLWDEAVAHAAYLRNRAPTRALEGKTPYEAWHGKRPSVAHLREFGCDVWVLDESKKRTKLDPKSTKMKFMGFMDGSKSIRYYDPTNRNVKVSRNFAFNENDDLKELEIVEIPGMRSEGEHNTYSEPQTSFPRAPEREERPSSPKTIPNTPKSQPPVPDAESEGEVEKQLTPVDTPRPKQKSKNQVSQRELRALGILPEEVQQPTQAPTQPTMSKRPQTRKSGEGAHFAFQAIEESFPDELIFMSTLQEPDLPKTYEQAMSGPEAVMWKEAMDEELKTLTKMGTWVLGDLPEGRQTVGCHWVYTRKHDKHNKLVGYKARLVAQGFSQKPGQDFAHDGTFAPVMRFDTLRTVLGISAVRNLKLRQFDIKGAYLHGELKEEIYMRQPPGYSDGTGRVCVLKRSLYGLKQAGNVWNHALNSKLEDLGFIQLKSDYCCYIRWIDQGYTILLVWVDDIIATSSEDALNDRIEAELKDNFETKSLGQPKFILAIQLAQNHNSIALSQSHYIDALLERFGLTGANPVSTPIDPNVKLDNFDAILTEGESDIKVSRGYATMIGSLMYLALGTRPDICYAVNKLAQYTANPKPIHWTAVKRVFRYLKGTRDHYLAYGGSQDLLTEDLNIFTDADWANDPDRKSVSGYVIMLAGGAISWASKKQATVALSTAEAEYIAAAYCAKQVLWQRHLFEELSIPLPTTSTIFSDNQVAVAIGHHPEFHAQTKHIDIVYHFL